MTKVINIRNHQKIEYEPCCRGTIFGNPFVLGRDGNREEVIDKYNIWFNQLLKDPRFVNELLKLKDKNIGCYCFPLSCHCDIIKKYLDNL